MPLRVPRVRIPVSPLSIAAKKPAFISETPSSLGVSLRFWPRLLARICGLVPGCQECKKGKTVTIRGKLNGTNTGTSAPLTAPFFRRFPVPRRSEKPVHYSRTAPAPAAFPSRRYRQSEGASHVRRRHDSRVVRSMHRHRLPATCLFQVCEEASKVATTISPWTWLAILRNPKQRRRQ